MGDDLADLAEAGPAEGQQAVVDLDDLLADDRQVPTEEQVVDLVEAAGGRVLDRQEPEVGFTAADRGGDLGEGAAPRVTSRGIGRGEEPLRGFVAVGAFDALEDDRQRRVPLPRSGSPCLEDPLL